MTELDRLKNMFFLAYDLGVNSQARGALPAAEVVALADNAWGKYILCNDPTSGQGPVVLVSAPGVDVLRNFTCPDCSVTGDAIRGATRWQCLACMEVE